MNDKPCMTETQSCEIGMQIVAKGIFYAQTIMSVIYSITAILNWYIAS